MKLGGRTDGRTRGPGLWASWLVAVALGSLGTARGAPSGEVIRSSRYEVSGNTLLEASAIRAALAAYESAAELGRWQEAAAAVQDLYRVAGYGAVVAFVPAQTLQTPQSLVRIQVVEGKLQHIELQGNRHFSRENILASLPGLQAGRTPQLREIDAQIQMANESPAKTVQVLLQPGTEPGAVNASISVAEQPLQRWSARLDNTGSASTGRWRTALAWQHGDVGGQDQVANAEVQISPEHPSELTVASAVYRVPLYARAQALDLYAAWYQVQAAQTATVAGNLDFAGKGHVLGMRLSDYLARRGSTDQRLVLGLEEREYDNNCNIEGLPAGACGTAGASVSVQPLSLQYTAQSAGRSTRNLSLGLSYNLALGGGRGGANDVQAVRPGGRLHYSVMHGSAQVGGPLLDDGSAAASGTGTVSLRAAWQGSPDALIPGEQFGLGGAQSVRGYEERELSGDTGVQGSLEFRSAELLQRWAPGPAGLSPAGEQDSQLYALMFVDAGWLHNNLATPCLNGLFSCYLSSYGAGLRYTHARWQLRLDWGHALSNGTVTRKGGNRLHAALNMSF